MLLRKGVYPYEYMIVWERFDETSLSDKEEFYSNVNMEKVTAKIICMQKKFLNL